MKVEPLNAILDPQYFVRAVHGCVLAVLRARSEMSEQHSADNSGFRCGLGLHPRASTHVLQSLVQCLGSHGSSRQMSYHKGMGWDGLSRPCLLKTIACLKQ